MKISHLLLPIFLVVTAATARPQYEKRTISTSVLERGQHYKTVETVVQRTAPSGETALSTNRYTILRNGMHYKDAEGNWVESSPAVQMYQNAVVCTGATYRVILAKNLNTPGAVDFETSDQQRIISHPLGIGMFDPKSGRSVFLARVKNCKAELVSSNEVVYRDAFEGNGVEAAITYTYDVGRFHQDVTFVKSPSFTPATFGMGDKTRLEIYTEILSGPLATKSPRILRRETNSVARAKMAEPDLFDETVILSKEMRLPLGRAFIRKADRASGIAGLTVARRLLSTEDKRTVLVESLAWGEVQDDLRKLPTKSASASGNRPQATRIREFPKYSMTGREAPSFRSRLVKETQTRGATRLAGLDDNPSTTIRKFGARGADVPQGFVIDYQAVQTMANASFGWGTYYIHTEVDFTGTTDIYGAVVKFSASDDDTPGLTVHDCIDFVSSSVFTSSDDDSVGDIIDGSTGNPFAPSKNGYLMIDSDPQCTAVIETLDLRFLTVGLFIASDYPEDSSIFFNIFQIRNCNTGFSFVSPGVNFYLDSVSYCNVDTLYDQGPYGDNSVTIDASADAECYDLNGNGMPDLWELDNFGYVGVDPNADPDHDGMTNVQEYQAGTNPLNQDSNGDHVIDQPFKVAITRPANNSAVP